MLCIYPSFPHLNSNTRAKTLNLNFQVKPFRYTSLAITGRHTDRYRDKRQKSAFCFRLLQFYHLYSSRRESLCIWKCSKDEHIKGKNHVFSTAGRSKGLPANSVPEEIERQVCKCVHMSSALACLCPCDKYNQCIGVRSQLESHFGRHVEVPWLLQIHIFRRRSNGSL